MAVINEARKKYGRLRVLRRVENNARGEAMWRCRCKCGTVTTVKGSDLRSGNTQSCGCWNRELASARRKIHGRSYTIEYLVWRGIKTRCYNPKATGYDRYGGRGIRMAKRWLNSFENFFADVGPRPSPKHTIDRYPDSDGDYEPGNVRWATKKEQSVNKSNTRYVVIGGKKRPAIDVAREHGISPPVLQNRIFRNGWSVERACTQPIKRK